MAVRLRPPIGWARVAVEEQGRMADHMAGRVCDEHLVE